MALASQPEPPPEQKPRDVRYIHALQKLTRVLDCPDEDKVVRWGYARDTEANLVRVTMLATHDIPEALAPELVAAFAPHVCPRDNPLGIAYAIRSDAPAELIGAPERPRMPAGNQVSRLVLRCACGEKRTIRRGPWLSATRKYATYLAIYDQLQGLLLRSQLGAVNADPRPDDKAGSPDQVLAYFALHAPVAMTDLVERRILAVRRTDDGESYRLALRTALEDLDVEACPILESGELPTLLGEEEIVSRYVLWGMSMRSAAGGA